MPRARTVSLILVLFGGLLIGLGCGLAVAALGGALLGTGVGVAVLGGLAVAAGLFLVPTGPGERW